jgi:RalA-binding protein 1
MPHSEEHRPTAGVAPTTASRPSAGSTLSQSTSSQSAIPASSFASSTGTAPTLTLEATLQAYSNDTLAALEAVIQERNSLHAQNSQLWKLFEKQRSMYNTANRELEKLRSAANIGLSSTSNSSNTSKVNGSTISGQEGASGPSTSKKPDRPERAEERREKPSRTNSEEQRKFPLYLRVMGHICLHLPLLGRSAIIIMASVFVFIS